MITQWFPNGSPPPPPQANHEEDLEEEDSEENSEEAESNHVVERRAAEVSAAVGVEIHKALGEWVLKVGVSLIRIVPGMPVDLIQRVVEFAVDETILPTHYVCSACDCDSCKANQLRLSWTSDASTPETVVTCSSCGALRHFVDAGPSFAGAFRLPVAVVTRPAEWTECPHFHIEEQLMSSFPHWASAAVRHRMSRWHNYRTAIGREWIHRGKVRYRLRLTSHPLQQSNVEFVVGAVGSDAEVNAWHNWVPGRTPESVGFEFRRAAVAASDVARIDVWLDADNSTIELCLGSDNSGGWMEPATAPKGVLAVAVALKFSRDTMCLSRLL